MRAGRLVSLLLLLQARGPMTAGEIARQRAKMVIDDNELDRLPKIAALRDESAEEVGVGLGITRERVRQLESRALRELRAVAPDLELYLRT